jgi:glycosyltransferase involved in cell wall biosynthesis
LNILYVCREVDERARWTAIQARWISTLARMPGVEHVHVLTPRAGEVTLPANVTVREFGNSSPSRFVRNVRMLFAFWREVLLAGPFRQDLFFVVQGGPYPAQLLPFKLLTGRPIFQWKAQQHVSPRMRFYARYCDDLLFTATEQSFPMDLPNKRVVGHGIDTDLFRPAEVAEKRDFVTVGRISPIKKIDRMLHALALHRDKFGTVPSLDIIGEVTRSSRAHAAELEALAERLGLRDAIRFVGHVDYGNLPALLSGYRAFLNLSGTAFDKAVGEAMACGVPVLTTNPCVVESLPAELRPYLVVDGDGADALAASMRAALGWDPATRGWLATSVRQHVVQEHGLHAFFGKILAYIRAHPRIRASMSSAPARA